MWFNRLSFSYCLTLRYIYMFHRRDLSSASLINNFEVVHNPLKAHCFRMFFFLFFIFFVYVFPLPATFEKCLSQFNTMH